jgi:hypothetical protein
VITVTCIVELRSQDFHTACHHANSNDNADHVDPANSDDKHNSSDAYGEFKLLVGSALELMCILYDKKSTIGKFKPLSDSSSLVNSRR